MSTPSERIDDFPDRFSPMLVKELRQGLRGKTFVVVFLVLQVLLSFFLLGAGAIGSTPRAGTFVSEVVFVFFSMAALVIQPLRGVGALSGEIRNNTIDLMVLTRLGALRIVLGKWVSVVSQTALMAVTIFPYLILRYYLGGMDLFAELLLVLMIFMLSAGLTAVTVGLSGCRSILIRGLLPVLGTPALAMVILRLGFGRGLDELIEFCSLSDATRSFALLGFLVAVAYIGWSMLSLGASQIAPTAENHSTPRRLIALGLMLLWPLMLRAMNAPVDAVPFLWFIIAAPAIGIALSEEENPVSTVYRPFVRKGLIGRIAGGLLYPGWPSGVVFSLVLGLIGFAGLAMLPGASGSHLMRSQVYLLALLGSLLLPGMLIVLTGPKFKDRAAAFILLWIAFVIVGLVGASLGKELGSSLVLWGLAWDPVTLLPMSDLIDRYDWVNFEWKHLLLSGTIANGIYLLVLLLKSIPAFRRIRSLEQETPSE